MPGAIAKNAQEGTRSEYLAQYALSSFGTAIPVPHPEDSGIDLYCTLGRRIGRRFLVENPYLVQVKSNDNPISYFGVDEVNWLLSHNYPFLICIVNKKKARVELYQTMALSLFSAKKCENITLHINDNKFDTFPHESTSKNINISLGDPIIRFPITALDGGSFNKKLSKVLKSWIEVDQENIDLKSTGFTLFRTANSWQTNECCEALTIKGNFKESFENENNKKKFDDVFSKMLSQLINNAVCEKDIHKYSELLSFTKSYTSRYKHFDSFGARILEFSINAGNKEFGINDLMVVTTNKNTA